MENNALNTRSHQLTHDNDDEINLLKLWSTIWQQKWKIIILTLVVSVITAVIVANITPIYRAAVTVMIAQQKNNIVSIEQMYGFEGAGKEYLETQFQLLKSRTLSERVVKELDLTNHPEFDPRQQKKSRSGFRGWIDALKHNKLMSGFFSDTQTTDTQKVETSTNNEEEIFKSVVKNFMSRISLEPLGASAMGLVQVDMADPRMAAKAANRLVQAFIESQLEASMEMSADASAWMNSRLDELRVKLKAAEEELQAFREQENLVDIGGVATISAAELAATSNRMVDARSNRAEAESLYRQVQSMKSGGWRQLATVSSVLGDPLIQQFKVQEAQAKSKVNELSKRYGNRHPVMIAAQTELTAAEASLRGQVEQVVAAIERNYRLALANESSLLGSVNENRAQIQDIARKEFQLREYQREVDSNRALYDIFLTRIKETAATSDFEMVNARVIDKATVPTAPIKPQKTIIVIAATFLALLLGVGLSLLKDILNNTFKSVDDVENKLNLPVLGILPLIHKKQSKSIARLFENDDEKEFSESVRTIRTSLVLSELDKPHKVILVTSSVPNEGKSTVATNLAIALGQIEKVLFIDADMRRPSVAKNFDLPVGSSGLANVIAGTSEFVNSIQHISGVDILNAGAVPPDPLELLSSPRFVELIERLKGQYDRIVIDSPPTQVVSDALMIGNLANALVYVIKSDDTAISHAVKGVGQLLQNNIPITGVVINQVDIKKAGYSYGGYYDHYGYNNLKAKV